MAPSGSVFAFVGMYSTRFTCGTALATLPRPPGLVRRVTGFPTGQPGIFAALFRRDSGGWHLMSRLIECPVLRLRDRPSAATQTVEAGRNTMSLPRSLNSAMFSCVVLRRRGTQRRPKVWMLVVPETCSISCALRSLLRRGAEPDLPLGPQAASAATRCSSACNRRAAYFSRTIDSESSRGEDSLYSDQNLRQLVGAGRFGSEMFG